MSIENWKKIYYNVPVETLARKEVGDAFNQDIIEHSLIKWMGLAPDILEAYEIFVDGTGNLVDRDGTTFNINCGTCSLCYFYAGELGKECPDCPIYKIRGCRCDTVSSTYSEYKYTYINESPFSSWRIRHNPELMIKLLKDALQREKVYKFEEPYHILKNKLKELEAKYAVLENKYSSTLDKLIKIEQLINGG